MALSAWVKRNGERTKFLSLVNVNGYVAYIKQEGIGEPIFVDAFADDVFFAYKEYKTMLAPFFNDFLLKNVDIKKRISLMSKNDIYKIIGTDDEKYLAKWGKNEGGMEIELENEETIKVTGNSNKEFTEKELNEAKSLAKETGKPVILRKIIMPEEESPLKDDEEDDLVTYTKYMMPDGKIKETWCHNY